MPKQIMQALATAFPLLPGSFSPPCWPLQPACQLHVPTSLHLLLYYPTIIAAAFWYRRLRGRRASGTMGVNVAIHACGRRDCRLTFFAA